MTMLRTLQATIEQSIRHADWTVTTDGEGFTIVKEDAAGVVVVSPDEEYEGAVEVGIYRNPDAYMNGADPLTPTSTALDLLDAIEDVLALMSAVR